MRRLSDEELDILWSKTAIHELRAVYCRGVDRADEELLRSISHPDATFNTGTFEARTDEFVKAILEIVRTGLKSSFHTVTNEWVEINGDIATGECYLTAVVVVVVDGKEIQSLVGGRYLDRFERRDGVWKFAQRVFVMDWNVNLPSTASAAPPSQTVGSLKPNDFSYSFLNAVGKK